MSLGIFCEVCGSEQKVGMFYLYLHNVFDVQVTVHHDKFL